MGGEFLLPEYGVFILPRNGTTVAFSTSTVLHCTNVAHGYNNIGMSYSAKWNVQKKATTRTKEILSFFKDHKYYSIFYYSTISKKMYFLLCLIIIYRLCAHLFIFLTYVVVKCLFFR